MIDDCVWKKDPTNEYNVYDTLCYESFGITDGTPRDNNFKFCPYCGGKIVNEETSGGKKK